MKTLLLAAFFAHGKKHLSVSENVERKIRTRKYANTLAKEWKSCYATREQPQPFERISQHNVENCVCQGIEGEYERACLSCSAFASLFASVVKQLGKTEY